MTQGKRCALTIGISLLVSRSADAHIVAARLGDFYTGALHPLTDLTDIILWLALGIVAGTNGTRGRWLVIILPLGLLAGLSIQLGWGFGSIGTVANAALMVALGLLLAAGIRLNIVTLAAVAFALAVVRGAANAGGISSQTDLTLYGAGLATAGYAAITLVMALTAQFRRADVENTGAWRAIAVRVCGSWIAAIGLMMGGFALKAGL